MQRRNKSYACSQPESLAQLSTSQPTGLLAVDGVDRALRSCEISALIGGHCWSLMFLSLHKERAAQLRSALLGPTTASATLARQRMSHVHTLRKQLSYMYTARTSLRICRAVCMTTFFHVTTIWDYALIPLSTNVDIEKHGDNK